MAEGERRVAFYAAARGGWRDWWTLLHPPYTAWHLAYVAIGASLAPETDTVRLAATLLAFFLAVGVAAHALDEVHGHPLRTAIPDAWLWAVGGAALMCAVVLGLLGVTRAGPGLLVFIAVGPLLVLGYNLELFGGRLHTDAAFAVAWGSFPLLTAYFAQAERVDVVALAGGAAAFLLSYGQRALSTPARLLRRGVAHADATLVLADGTVRQLGVGELLAPLERALRALSWSMVALAVALVAARTR